MEVHVDRYEGGGGGGVGCGGLNDKSSAQNYSCIISFVWEVECIQKKNILLNWNRPEMSLYFVTYITSGI